jgi:hypothetical protein
MDFTVDTRTATEYGVVRTFADMVFTWTGGEYVGASSAATPGGTTLYNSTTGTIGGASLGLYHAFIQFAGFTFGRTVSIFDAPWQSYPAGGPDTLPGGSNHVTGVNQVAYTAQFGQGMSASVALQDPTVYDTTAISNLSFPGGSTPSITPNGTVSFLTNYGAPSLAGALVAPDIVGAFTVDQAWGLFKFSAVAHDNHAGYYGANETTGHPSDKWGWAVQGALSIKNIPTGPGDSLNLQGVYTDGASRYNFQSLFPTTIAMFGGSSIAYQSLGFAAINDAVFTSVGGAAGLVNSGLETVKTWGFRGGFTHNWDPYWASASTVPMARCNTAILPRQRSGVGGVSGTARTRLVCWHLQPRLQRRGDRWHRRLDGEEPRLHPRRQLDELDQVRCYCLYPTSATAKPGATYELKDQNSVSMLLRAQRNF